MGRLLLNPFTRKVQDILIKKVGSESKMYDFFKHADGFSDAYRACTDMLNGEIGWAIENPLLIMRHIRDKNFTNDFACKDVVCCCVCYVCCPKSESQYHNCPATDLVDVYDRGFMNLRDARFQKYMKDRISILTDPQKAVYEVFRPMTNSHDGNSSINRFGNNVLLQGPPGTGKSFVHYLIVWSHWIKFGWDSILVVGVILKASSSMLNGRTIHSAVGIHMITDEIIKQYIAPETPFQDDDKYIENLKEFLKDYPLSPENCEYLARLK